MLEPPAIQTSKHVYGSPPAPPPESGGAHSSRPAEVPRPQPTVFPPELETVHPRTLLYWLGWAQLGGLTLLRWLWYVGVALSLAILLLPIGGKAWWIGALWIVLLAVTAARPLLARSHFVTFTPETHSPDADDWLALGPNVKHPVHVTGTLSVETKQRFFLWLPGFYRTFATREHALLCQCRERRILSAGATPETDIGLWYAFWYTRQIADLQRGTLRAASEAAPAIRMIYRIEGKKNRLGGAGTSIETLYIACQSPADRDMIWRDLLADQTTHKHTQLPAT